MACVTMAWHRTHRCCAQLHWRKRPLGWDSDQLKFDRRILLTPLLLSSAALKDGNAGVVVGGCIELDVASLDW
jgi:hypothetical protein